MTRRELQIDAPPTHLSEPYRVGIVGGGASGGLLAAMLLRQATAPLRVTVFDPAPELARGVAYSTDDPLHLLNVPARNMSALVADPDHFRSWARCSDTDFVPRSRYGDYLQGVLRDAEQSAHPGVGLEHVRDTVVAVRPAALTHLTTSHGHTMAFDSVILATGHGAPQGPAVLGQVDPAAVITNPWNVGALDGIDTGDEVLVVGTGLTFVDVALSILDRSSTTRVHAISQHGLLPQAHETPWRPGHPAPELPDEDVDPRAVLRYVRSFGVDWRRGLDSLRPITPAIWLTMDESRRERFLRHLVRYWNTHRHRMAPEVARRLDQANAAGRITVHRASLADASSTAGRIRAVLSSGEVLTVDRVVVCTGPSADVRDCDLGRQMVSSGIARPGPFDVGFDCDPSSGALLDAEGNVSSSLFTIGPPRCGVVWESTAIPEIRVQADALSRTILAGRSRSRVVAGAWTTKPPT